MKTRILNLLFALMFVVGISATANAQGSFQRVIPPTGFAEQGDTKVYVCISSATTFPCAGGDLASIYSDRALTSAITQTSGRSVAKNSQEVVYYIAPGLYQEVFYSATMGFYYARLFNAPGDATLLNASVARIADPTDPTKKIAFTASGNATASTLTLAAVAQANRTVSFPDAGAASAVMLSLLTTNAPDAANSVSGASNALVFEGATADGFELSVVPADVTADRTATIPDATFTVGQVEAAYSMLANGSLADQTFFTATRGYIVTACSQVHSVAGSDAGAVNIQVTKDTSTNAPGTGTDLLTNNTNAGFDAKGTANTVQTGTLVASAATKTLAAGDRLAVDFAGTLTNLAGVQVTCSLQPIN